MGDRLPLVGGVDAPLGRQAVEQVRSRRTTVAMCLHEHESTICATDDDALQSGALWVRLLLLGTGAWLSGCGSAGHLEGQVFHGQDATYRVGHLGSDWKRLDVEGQNDLAFALPSQAAIIQVNASCDPALDIPLEALTKHLLIGFTDRDVRSQERVPMAAREALRTHATAKMDGVPRELIFQFKKRLLVHFAV
ncbi:MAG: hypothetical protein ACOC9O_02060, partial [Myxococcota bacterium]